MKTGLIQTTTGSSLYVCNDSTRQTNGEIAIPRVRDRNDNMKVNTEAIGDSWRLPKPSLSLRGPTKSGRGNLSYNYNFSCNLYATIFSFT
jgi:hypothetical protein